MLWRLTGIIYEVDKKSDIRSGSEVCWKVRDALFTVMMLTSDKEFNGV